jgi:hypothetical protein
MFWGNPFCHLVFVSRGQVLIGLIVVNLHLPIKVTFSKLQQLGNYKFSKSTWPKSKILFFPPEWKTIVFFGLFCLFILLIVIFTVIVIK